MLFDILFDILAGIIFVPIAVVLFTPWILIKALFIKGNYFDVVTSEYKKLIKSTLNSAFFRNPNK